MSRGLGRVCSRFATTEERCAPRALAGVNRTDPETDRSLLAGCKSCRQMTISPAGRLHRQRRNRCRGCSAAAVAEELSPLPRTAHPLPALPPSRPSASHHGNC